MIFHKTKIKDVYIIEPELKKDKRGYFFRFFDKEEFAKEGLFFDIVQASQSFTKKKGTVRGMHFQREPKSEIKIVQCLKGAIYDVVIDLREGSITYGQWVSAELTQDNKKMLLIPKGCGHGFQALTNNCEVQYFMSEFHSPENEGGARYDDSFLNIKWPIKNPLLSEKDKSWSPIKGNLK